MPLSCQVLRATALGLLAIVLGAASASAQAVQWRPDYGSARKEAAQSRQAVVMIFSSEHCPWCRQLEGTTLRDPAIVGLLNRGFIPLRVATEDARNAYLVQALRIEGVPAVVLVAPGGQVLSSQAGYLDPSTFQALLQPHHRR